MIETCEQDISVNSQWIAPEFCAHLSTNFVNTPSKKIHLTLHFCICEHNLASPTSKFPPALGLEIFNLSH